MGSTIALNAGAGTLVWELRDAALPVWRHFGATVSTEGLPELATTRAPASYSLDDDVPLSVAPVSGLGWFGPEVLRLGRNGSALTIAFPGSAVTEAAASITFRSTDPIAGVELEQVFEAVGAAYVCRSSVRNVGTTAFSVDWLASALLPITGLAREVVSWRGRHNAELLECRESMPQQAWVREVRRGISGHGGPGGLLILDEGATFHAGQVRALQLAWTGDNRISVDRDDEGFWTLCAGAVLQPGEVVLQPGESWNAPNAIVAVSHTGRNGAAAAFHDAVRARLRWPGGAMRPRPVHLNSWEACYFDHDEERIVALAEAAASVGVERFILDDGWFRNRDDDTAGLGDWTTDPRKYPKGLKPLADRVNALGMEFGLWVEPEMVNPDSDLYRTHPDWALSVPGQDRPTARNQLVLDLRREDVREYLFGCLDALLTELPITYLKWDHNRDLAPAGGASQVRGVYDLLARVRRSHPRVEVESCAGGGGRNDAGMAEFCHRYWTSDNIDAASRIGIQRGFLSFLPPEVMGSHIAASPAHATGRRHSLAFRAAMAMTGHLGVEMDPRTLTEDERSELADWIAFYKQWRGLLHAGNVWLGDGSDGLRWQAQGRADEMLLFVIRADPPADRRPQPLPLPFCGNTGTWLVSLLRIAGGEGGHAAHSTQLFEAMKSVSQPFPADWLASSGLPLPPDKAETVTIFHLRKRT
ncbi:alpha-galactosidase [Novosphingobium taihuense]|uniref:alpha-galactosidase n=1 Tax=Novosphingobium taihuense TaxID=260085 RepID=A0A7W7ABF1_9SPHN|nr:alpha-galactosidase [Novosphingobium taihuense]MBB4613776.1 alpha-galactosidase [Novosphingobium taihuense]TWH83285.1 alpha-galactosidase [Novosphingobium taihuense]